MAFSHEPGWGVIGYGGQVYDWEDTEAAALTAADVLVFDNPDTDTFFVVPMKRVRQTP